jgi:hypothetical protein
MYDDIRNKTLMPYFLGAFLFANYFELHPYLIKGDGRIDV